MEQITNIFKERGFSAHPTYLSNQEIVNSKEYKDFIQSDNPTTRFSLIKLYLKTSPGIYLVDWKRYFPSSHMNEIHQNRIDLLFYCLEISFPLRSAIDISGLYAIFNLSSLDMERSFESFAKDGGNMNDIIEFFSPGWKIRSQFYNENEFFLNCTNSFIDSIKENVDFDGLINEIYEEIPNRLRTLMETNYM